MKSLTAPRPFCLTSTVLKISRIWNFNRTLTAHNHLRRYSRWSKFLSLWLVHILHRATPMSMKTWTTLRQALHQQTTPNNAGAPSSTWYSSGALVLIFRSFWSFDDKGGEIWVSLQAGLSYMGIFFLSYNSRSFEDFAGSSCKLKLYGGLILLLSFFCMLIPH